MSYKEGQPRPQITEIPLAPALFTPTPQEIGRRHLTGEPVYHTRAHDTEFLTRPESSIRTGLQFVNTTLKQSSTPSDWTTWDQYYHSPTSDKRTQEFYPSMILKYLNPHKSHIPYGLDYGSGNGALALSMLEHNSLVTPVDPYLTRDEVHPRLRESFQQLPVFDGQTVTTLPFNSQTFDWISMISVVEHMPESTFRVLLQEFQRVSNPQAPILIHFPPNTFGFNMRMLKRKITGEIPFFSGKGNIVQRFLDRRDTDHTHVRWYSPRYMKRLLKRQGYEIAETIPFLLKSHVKEKDTKRLSFKVAHFLQESLNKTILQEHPSLFTIFKKRLLISMMTPFALGYSIVAKNSQVVSL